MPFSVIGAEKLSALAAIGKTFDGAGAEKKSMAQGTLSVHTERLFPIIKKFLYSDHEIFLRELVANAVDATQKLKMLASSGEFDGELGDLTIKLGFDKESKTITLTDRGIGMTETEVEQYINQIAFSSAEAFVDKFKDQSDGAQIIGHFGLGFYSAFMVAEKVVLQTKSYKDAPAIEWECEGSTEYEMREAEKEDRGTTLTLHIAEDSEEFLDADRLKGILEKYARFMPVPIEFEGEIINDKEPLWLKKPSELTDEDYLNFYKELYPYSPDPLFHVHLNVDHPFSLTGILYFPKITTGFDPQAKNKIQLYSNSVFITDEVKEIVPEFLTYLHGVIDSPDIPLNVSRSYLQADSNVKKISSHIVKKAADKLGELFRDNRQDFEQKWSDVGFFVKYGTLTDSKFADRAKAFSLVKNVDGEFFTFDEYAEKTAGNQKDKDETLIWLYTNDAHQLDSYAAAAKARGYDVLLLDQPIDSHWIGQLEQSLEKTRIVRVDSESLERLIDKGTELEQMLGKEELESLEGIYRNQMDDKGIEVKLEPLQAHDAPVTVVQSEWMRRFQEMSRMQGRADMGMPSFTLIVNTNHPVQKRILQKGGEPAAELARQMIDLAKLSGGLLQGKDLSAFVQRSMRLSGE